MAGGGCLDFGGLCLKLKPISLSKPLVKVDDRVIVMENDPYNWHSFDIMTEKGHIADVPIVDWNSGGKNLCACW